MKKSILIAGLFVFTFSACKKSNDDGTPACTLTDANFTGAYKISSVKYKSTPTAAEIDDPGIIVESCAKDDIITFVSNHTYTVVDAGTKCSPVGDDNGTWSLSGNTLTLDGDSQTVENFSCTGFSFIETDVLNSGDKVTISVQKQ